jgi:lysozyme family protein
MRDISLEHYEDLYSTIKILPDWTDSADHAASLVLDGQDRYQQAADLVGVPWTFIGLVHLMECDCDFNSQILNGESWKKRTTLVPKGLGPWDSWEASCLEPNAPEALWRYKGKYVWTLGRMAKEFERWNGFGYAVRNKESPYLWSGSQHGIGTGKYRYDGRYSPTAVSDQPGALVVLRKIEEMGVETGIGTTRKASTDAYLKAFAERLGETP